LLLSVNKFDTETVTYINHLMKNINDMSDDIYESLMDRDVQSASRSIKELKNFLEELLDQL